MGWVHCSMQAHTHWVGQKHVRIPDHDVFKLAAEAHGPQHIRPGHVFLQTLIEHKNRLIPGDSITPTHQDCNCMLLTSLVPLAVTAPALLVPKQLHSSVTLIASKLPCYVCTDNRLTS